MAPMSDGVTRRRLYNGAGSIGRSRARTRWNPALIEARKVVVAEIPKSDRPPTVIRVSVFRERGHDYVDLRLYRLGRGGAYPSAVGLPIHRDLLPAVLAGLTAASEHLDSATRDLAETSRPGCKVQPLWR